MNKETKTPFLDFYKKHYESKQMPLQGLCNNFNWHPYINMFSPSDGLCFYYWASSRDSIAARYRFNPIRQTIVLFCAAINNEL